MRTAFRKVLLHFKASILLHDLKSFKIIVHYHNQTLILYLVASFSKRSFVFYLISFWGIRTTSNTGHPQTTYKKELFCRYFYKQLFCSSRTLQQHVWSQQRGYIRVGGRPALQATDSCVGLSDYRQAPIPVLLLC